MRGKQKSYQQFMSFYLSTSSTTFTYFFPEAVMNSIRKELARKYQTFTLSFYVKSLPVCELGKSKDIYTHYVGDLSYHQRSLSLKLYLNPKHAIDASPSQQTVEGGSANEAGCSISEKDRHTKARHSLS